MSVSRKDFETYQHKNGLLIIIILHVESMNMSTELKIQRYFTLVDRYF